MLATVRATITAIVRADAQGIEARAVADGEQEERRVMVYPSLTGPISVDDTVLLNVTATSLTLGTGGYDYVTANLSAPLPATHGNPDGTEHIIKLRYTPHQHAVRAIEMDEQFADIWARENDLRGTPIVVCGLHSQIAPVCAAAKARQSDARVAYVYTDAAALPIAFSRLVQQLNNTGLLDATITAGQAFGGDYEAVTVASALIAARFIANADVIVVAQGPGNAGTGTRYGFGGIEQGSYLDLAGALGGKAIAVLRVSDGDERDRHRGLSHHSETILGTITSRPAILPVPAGERWQELRNAVVASPIALRHTIREADTEPGMALLAERSIRVTTMGRTIEQDPAFFHFAAAAGATIDESSESKITNE